MHSGCDSLLSRSVLVCMFALPCHVSCCRHAALSPLPSSSMSATHSIELVARLPRAFSNQPLAPPNGAPMCLCCSSQESSRSTAGYIDCVRRRSVGRVVRPVWTPIGTWMDDLDDMFNDNDERQASDLVSRILNTIMPAACSLGEQFSLHFHLSV